MVLFWVSMVLIVIAMLFGVAITIDRNMSLSKALKTQSIVAENVMRALNRKSISATISAQEAEFYRGEVKRLERALRDKNREIIRLKTEAVNNEKY